MFKDSDIWEYAAYTKTAAENGGPDAYIQAVADNAFERGVASGEIKGIRETIGIASLAFLGYQGYKKLKAWRAAKREAKQSPDESRTMADNQNELERTEAFRSEIRHDSDVIPSNEERTRETNPPSVDD